MLGLLAAAGITPVTDLRLHLRPEDVAWWEAERERRGMRGARYAVFAPTSRWTSKDWPAERWRELAAPMFDRGFDRLVYLGTRGEAAHVTAAMPTGSPQDGRLVNLAGATGVGQSMAVIAAADLVIANDSAPLHIAVGFGRRLLALFGPTDPARVGPYRRDRSVLRGDAAREFRGSYRDRSIGDSLMRLIATRDVLAALDEGRAEAPREPVAAAGGIR